MALNWLPSKPLIAAVSALAVGGIAARAAGLAVAGIAAAAFLGLLLIAAWAALDLLLTRRRWQGAPLTLERELPHALALGVPRELALRLSNAGTQRWRAEVFDGLDPRLDFLGWPQRAEIGPGETLRLAARVTPRERGRIELQPAQLRLHSLAGAWLWQQALGKVETLAVLPNFAAVARLAWLAGDRRLSEVGIKPGVRRGEGIDFKQLREYRLGDAVRHIDWKASLRRQRPVVREYQDERDQRVLFLLDRGRRMRAAEPGAPGRHPGSHFDQALDALLLLAWVALKAGDEIAVLTYGAEAGEPERRFGPAKGIGALDSLVAALHDLQPGLGHADVATAAAEAMRRQHKRALVVILTNFRGEDLDELQPAIALLRTRHLVLLASLRETVLDRLRDQPPSDAEAVVVNAGAHLIAQQREAAFARLAAGDPLMIDVTPAELPAALVNRYLDAKRSGRL